MSGLVKKGNGARPKRHKHQSRKVEEIDYDSIYGYVIESKPVATPTYPITPRSVETVVTPILSKPIRQTRRHGVDL